MRYPALLHLLRFKLSITTSILVLLLTFLAGFFAFGQKTSIGTVPKAYAQVCPNNAANILFLIDKSGSMGNPLSKFTAAKSTSVEFINRIAARPPTVPITYVGAISYANPPIFSTNQTKLEWHLTRFYSNVTTKINGIAGPGGGTCTSCGIALANEQFTTYNIGERANMKNVIILITDDEATFTTDGQRGEAIAQAEAISEAQKVVDRHNAVIFTISVSSDISPDEIRYLTKIADDSGGKFYRANENTIDDALNQIFQIFDKGSLSGYKYNDVDKDGSIDSGEQRLSNWRIQLRNQQGLQVRAPATTNADGFYRFDNLCNGTYISSEQRQPEWDITEPIGNSRTVTISNGISLLNQNFGNVRYPAIHSISGNVFIDNNPKDDRLSAGEANYPGQVTIRYTLSGTPTKTITTSSSYVLPNLVQGNYVVELQYISPYNHYPLNRRFSVTVGPGCTFPSSAFDASCNGSNNITDLNFGLSAADRWTQTTGLDVRWDDGWTNKIQAGASCSPNASIPASSLTPGVIISGDQNSDFTPGKSSFKEWVVGGTQLQLREKYIKSTRLQTSYQSMLSTIKKSGTEIIPLKDQIRGIATCTDYNSCRLIGETNGVYSVDGNLKVTSGEILADNAKTVILVDGSVTINGDIHVKKGNFLMIVASGEIIVSKPVGSAPPSCSITVVPDVEGIYVSDSNFVVDGDDNCFIGPDNMLTMAGTIVVNAARNGGTVDNKRSLCEDNINFPSVKIRERPDFILNAPPYIQFQSTIWKEVAP